MNSPRLNLRHALSAWLGLRAPGSDSTSTSDKVEWLRAAPFLLLHLGCLAVIWVGASATAVWVAVGLYVVRMLAITGGYHRYFSHRTYQTSRAGQFLLAVIGGASVQRGALWWAAHHRHHHHASDQADDPHSPRQHGFMTSHVGWFLTGRNYRTRTELIPDLMRYPELRFLNRHDGLVPVLLGAALYALGALLANVAPELGTNGWQMFVWGFCISTVVLYHATFTINSLSHVLGHRSFETSDDSRNNSVLALLTLGEGWHNNHHHYPHSVRQGFRWWQYDITYMVIRATALLGLSWKLKPVPTELRRGQDRASGSAAKRH
ncbi:MAG: delta 9 acyl-lipid fatty acid desaturase [Planctomycetota bacterium]|nr:MAG: delta 9 acyl-lipid fatty acid desaturase [Planctomycetota bacterium]